MPPEENNDTIVTPEPAPTKPTDETAKLLKEVMKLKGQVKEQTARLEAFQGIDTDKINQLVERSERATAAAREAENDRLLKAGDYDAWKARVVADQKATQAQLQQELANERASIERSDAQIRDLTVTNAFAGSQFVSNETILTTNKARKLYEDHLEVQDGKVVAFNAPRNAADRTPLVDADGAPLPFDAAIRALVNADPDRDHLIKASRMATIANAGRSAEAQRQITAGIGRIAAAVQDGALAKMKDHLDHAAERRELAKPDASKITASADIAHAHIAAGVSSLTRILPPKV